MTVHGTARFATQDELTENGLLGDWTPQAAPDGLMLGWWWESEYDFAPIRYEYSSPTRRLLEAHGGAKTARGRGEGLLANIPRRAPGAGGVP